jgi:hypothetical protein
MIMRPIRIFIDNKRPVAWSIRCRACGAIGRNYGSLPRAFSDAMGHGAWCKGAWPPRGRETQEN